MIYIYYKGWMVPLVIFSGETENLIIKGRSVEGKFLFEIYIGFGKSEYL